MDVTNRFVLDYATRLAHPHPETSPNRRFRVLDYGCGAGKLASEGQRRGLNIVGADVFYSGSNAREQADAAGLLGDTVVEILDGHLPFDDATFDLVVNNQVMEHVEDLDSVLREIQRVLKPGGQVLSLFPSRDVLREGHIGIPLSHRMRKGSRFRFLYTWLLRSLGMGYWKDQSPTARQWAIDKLDWIDCYTVYRSRREIFATYNRYFDSQLIEEEYIRYRLLDRPGRGWVLPVLRLPLATAAANELFRKLAFLVILSTKRSDSAPVASATAKADDQGEGGQ
jgi:SAM-dependent methyltransferase